MQTRIAAVAGAMVLGTTLLSGYCGTQAVTSALPPTARPAQPIAGLGATSEAFPSPTSTDVLPATARSCPSWRHCRV